MNPTQLFAGATYLDTVLRVGARRDREAFTDG